MGFLTGRVTALRFKVSGTAPQFFEEEHLERLRDRAAGRQRIASADGTEVGWAAGDSVLDTKFALEKNVVNDALLFDLRVDTDKLPPDLLKAYYRADLEALAKDNPSGFASARQKREAKEASRDRLEAEAKDGRFKKRKCVPVMWDRQSNEVLFGATSATHVERLCSLFQETFGLELWAVTAGPRAALLKGHAYHVAAEALGAHATPSCFVPGVTPEDTAWIADEQCRDFLGNEFLLWLWYTTDVETDTVKTPDGSETTFMLARQLVVDCPRGVSGTDGFRSDGPNRLPEARRAIQAGKLPRRVGLTAVRHGEQYEFVLHAETLAVGAAKLPPPDDEGDRRAKLEGRVTAVRDLLGTVDQLYAAFVEVRLSARWAAVLTGMQAWLRGRTDRASGIEAGRSI